MRNYLISLLVAASVAGCGYGNDAELTGRKPPPNAQPRTAEPSLAITAESLAAYERALRRAQATYEKSGMQRCDYTMYEVDFVIRRGE